MRDYQAITTYAELDALVEELENGPSLVAFDVETGYSSAESVEKRSLNTRHPDFMVVGFSITNSPTWARYIPLHHADGQPLEPKIVWEKFRKIFETKQIIAHNASFERAALDSLYRAGEVERPLQMLMPGHDTMILANVLGQFKEVGLKALTKKVLGEDQTEFSDLFGSEIRDKTGKVVAARLKKVRFNSLPLTPEVINYGCDDSALCMELFETFYPMLDDSLKRVYSVEMQILLLMSQVEEYGIGVDWAAMQEALAQYNTFRPKFENKVREEFAAMSVDPEIKELARTANFGSAAQMRKLLYDGLGMRTTRTTEKGEMSTDAKALEALSRKHPAVRSLLSLREIDNLGRRLTKWLEEYSDCYDERVHPSFNQVRVVSGRFAASDPAVQQLGKQWLWDIDGEVEVDKEGSFVSANGVNGENYWTGNFRKFIVSAPNKTLLTFDYSQQELRVLAGVTQEPTFVKSFKNNEDPHKATASMLFDKALAEVTKDERQTGKAQPLDSKILTPTGWVRMGDLSVGDRVVGSDGNPTKVTGIFPQGKKEVFEVVTSDGVVECCEDHLWTVKTRSNTRYVERVLTTRQMLGLGVRIKRTKTAGSCRFMLPPRPVVHYENQETPLIDPYVLGLLLGDGNFTHDAIGFCSQDGELCEPVLREAARLGCKVSGYRVREGGLHSFYIWGTGSRKRGSNPLREALKHYGLDKTKCDTKFVPKEYLYGSAETRLEILRGILDTDGWVHQVCGGDICVANEQLALDVQELVQSLGGTASIKSKGVPKRYRTDDLYNSRLPVWLVHLSFSDETNPFKLERKANKYKNKKTNINQFIREIRPTGVFKEMQCISVESEDSLYVTNGFVLTHNTINFALLYGMGAKAMGEQLAISKEEAESLIDTYKSRLSRVGQWDAQSRRIGLSQGYVITWFGKRVPLWAASSDDPYVRSGAERLAVNAQIQGGAADYTKLAMIRAWAFLKKENLWGPDKVMMTMNQHDSLTFEVADGLDINHVRAILQEAVVFDAKKMFPKMQIPTFPRFDVDWELGKTWGGSVPWSLDVVAQKTDTGWSVDGVEDYAETREWSPLEENAVPSVQNVELPPEVLHVVWTGEISKDRVIAFNALVKENQGDTVVYLTKAGQSRRLETTCSLTKNDATKISMILGGAEVFERTQSEMEEML